MTSDFIDLLKKARYDIMIMMVNEKYTKEDYYYDAMDLLNKREYKDAVKFLEKAIEIDPHYVEAYVGLYSVYGNKKDRKKYLEYVDKAFEETQRKFKIWPKELEWGFIDNRQYLRAICEKACVYWDDGNNKEAEKLFRLLLKLNPNDNQGVRYLIAGMFRGLKGNDINEMFDEGNARQNWDKLEKLVKEENAKHKFWKPPK